MTGGVCAQAWGSDSNRVGHDHGRLGAVRRLIHRRPPARLIRWRAGACG
ncbi:phage-related integrase [Azoarcus sp. CIB]|nr:phage-related integrase [Azoarcus sp. CIB]